MLGVFMAGHNKLVYFFVSRLFVSQQANNY